MKRRIFAVLGAAMLLAAAGLGAQSLTVTQTDTGELLLRGRVNVYLSLTDQSGLMVKNPSAESLAVEEMLSDGDLRSLKILDVTPEAGLAEGIDFLLLVDNSGSMYDRFRDGKTRMDFARSALGDFFTSITGSEDRVAMAAFNTYLHPLAPLGSSPGELTRALSRIERPENESAYTELYAALDRLLSELASAGGRKAVIVLSDGENYPYARHAQTPHPLWADTDYGPDGTIRRYLEEEVSLYAVNFADARDPNLARVAVETGGTVFEARNSEELATVYESIRRRILSETRIGIEIPATRETDRTIVVTFGEARDEGRFFAPLLLGAPGDLPWYLPLAAALAAIAGLVALLFHTWENPAKEAEIQALGSNMTIALKNDVTVIGSGVDAHMTLAGDPGIDLHHATVVHDPQRGSYTLVSDRPVRVNNTLVKKRVLKAGDVIGIEGATVIFDAPAKD